jgi:hypothetical protein
VKALTWSVTGQPTALPPARSAGTGSCGASVPPWAVPSLVPRYLSARALRVVAARVDRRAFNRRELSFKARLTGRSSRKAPQVSWPGRPAGVQRSGVVAGPHPPCGVHSAVPPSGSGGPAVLCPAARCPPVQPAAVAPSVRTRPSRPTSGGGSGTRSLRRATCTTGTGRVPVGCHSLEGSVDDRAGPDAATLPGRTLVSRGRWRPGPGCGRAATAALGRCATRQAGPACRAPSLAEARWARSGLQREVPQRPRACRSWAGWATTVRGRRGALRPGGRARRGQWACRRR